MNWLCKYVLVEANVEKKRVEKYGKRDNMDNLSTTNAIQ